MNYRHDGVRNGGSVTRGRGRRLAGEHGRAEPRRRASRPMRRLRARRSASENVRAAHFCRRDVTGRLLLVPAIQDGFVAATNAVRGPTMTLGEAVNPIGSFTDPEYAQVGLTERRARGGSRRGGLDDPLRRDDAIIDGRTFGTKLIVDRATHKILGCHVVGERAVEITQVAAIAITAGMPSRRARSRSAFVSDLCRHTRPRGGQRDPAAQSARRQPN